MDDPRRARAIFVVMLLLAACSSRDAKPVTATGPDRVATGRACAKAVTVCGVGRCTADIENRCETPVTCQLHIGSFCKTAGGEQGPANATSKRITMLSGDNQRLLAAVSCGQGTAVATLVEQVDCF